MDMKNSGEILTDIAEQLADNNAGLISAGDVRDNMENIVYSINVIVASGDTDVNFPFANDVRAEHDAVGGTGGTFIAESGIRFPNSTTPDVKQLEPFRGEGNIIHNNLAGLAVGDPHPQYLNVAGVGASDNNMTGNLELGNNWIGASGNNSMGFKFVPNSSDTEDIYTSGDLVFGDNSRINTGFSVAKAWLNFDANGEGSVPVINSWYNINKLERHAPGKFTITFTSGVFANNYYVALGTSNGTTASGSKEDMDVNTVGCVIRDGSDDDDRGLRTCTFVIQDEGGDYVNGKLNDFVAYGYEPLATSGAVPTVVS
jgi:hypothetical protein